MRSIVIQRIMLYYVILLCFFKSVLAEYEPTWESLDSRPLPEWFDKSKVGIFIHWGVYSVPSFRSEWFWWFWQGTEPSPAVVTFMEKNYPPTFTYEDFAPQFTAEFFNAEEWADLLKKSGAKYVVLTSKHHEGYTLWPSNYSWNSADVGPKRDIVGELSSAIRSKDMIFGVYYSLYEWFHPVYKEDKANNWATTNFVDMKIIPEMNELINNYKPDVLWSDGDWAAPDTYWKSKEILAWLYNESPVKDTVVTNDRWGHELQCKHGGFLSCADRYNPGHLMERKWENAMTIDKLSWGYRRNAIVDDILTIHELITTLTQTVSCGGNILINVGPTKEGTIVPIFQERLIQLGTWLQINGDAIYETVPWSVQNDILTPSVWYTSKNNFVYAIVLEWPSNNVLSLGASPAGSDVANINLLGNENTEFEWTQNGNQTDITFPDKASVASEWAWVIQFSL